MVSLTSLMKRPEKTLARCLKESLSTSRIPAIYLNYALSDYFSIRPLGRFPRPNSTITVIHKNNSTDLSTHTIDLPFYGFSPQDVGALNDYCPSTSNALSGSFITPYSRNDDPLTFNPQKFSLSLEENNFFKNAPNFIH